MSTKFISGSRLHLSFDHSPLMIQTTLILRTQEPQENHVKSDKQRVPYLNTL